MQLILLRKSNPELFPERRPWRMFAAGVGIGFIAGILFVVAEIAIPTGSQGRRKSFLAVCASEAIMPGWGLGRPSPGGTGRRER